MALPGYAEFHNNTGTMVTSAEELLRAGKALGQAITPGEPWQPYAIIPSGYKLEPLTRAAVEPLPEFIEQFVRLDDAESFIAYVKQFSTHTTRIFASNPNLGEVAKGTNGGASFTAIIDYHQGGKDQQAGRISHLALYPLPLSIEFRTWLGNSGNKLKQDDFIKFVEANSPDIISPDSASLMELVLNFESTTTASFQSKINRVSGGRTLHFQEEVTQGAPNIGKMTVPEYMELCMPIFEGGSLFSLRARMEYKSNGGSLAITYYLQRPHEIFRKALLTMREEIAHALEIPVLTGSVNLAATQ